MADPGLEADGLTLGYAGEAVVRALSARIAPGRITALIGPNGSGKSTLLHGLSRLIRPMGGAVLLDGATLQDQPSRAVARRLAVMPQRPEAPEGLTVRELVAQGRYPHRGPLGAWTAADGAALERAMAAARVTAFADRTLDTLSGGQRQRVWIALALAQDTAYLLLDEPTTFLDMAHQIEVMETLVEANRSRGTTIVAALHDLNQAARYAHDLIAMAGGAVVAHGPAPHLVTAELIARVFGVEARVTLDPMLGVPVCVPLGLARPPAR
ncbi:MAG: ABC transporter ATP-binding protein [Pseudomonadota bacterium]